MLISLATWVVTRWLFEKMHVEGKGIRA